MENNTKMHDMSKLIGKMLGSYNGMIDVINNISGIMNKTKILALNSSIEASRAGAAGKGFSVIAGEISNFSKKSQDATNEGRKHMKSLNEDINNVVGVRTADVAYDLMDKIDRNLYERKCDVIGWADLEFVCDFLKDKSIEKENSVDKYIKRVMGVLDIYSDIIIVDTKGIMQYSVNHTDLKYKYDVSKYEWFKKCIKTGQPQVSDLYYNEVLKQNAMVFSAPVKTEKGEIIGVIYSLLNWDIIFKILSTAKIGNKGEFFLINKDGVVLSSKDKSDILEKNLSDSYSAAREVMRGVEYGFEIEEINGEIDAIIGYAHSKGFLHYKGKEWSVVVKEVFN